MVERTTLAGKFDRALTRTPDKAPGLFTAIVEQPGLKLRSIRGPVEVVVVDHLEQSTENEVFRAPQGITGPLMVVATTGAQQG